MKRILIASERIIRLGLLTICFYALITVVTKMATSNFSLSVDVSNIIYIIPVLLISFFSSLYVFKELKNFFSDDWEWEPKNLFEKFQNELCCLLGVGGLYYMFMLSIMLLYYPKFEESTLWGFPAYKVLFSLISMLMYILYRPIILKYK